MSRRPQQLDLFASSKRPAEEPPGADDPPLHLLFTLDLAAGRFLFDWKEGDAGGTPVASGQLCPCPSGDSAVLAWQLRSALHFPPERDAVRLHHASGTAFVNRLQKRFPVPDANITARVIPPCDWGKLKGGSLYQVSFTQTSHRWLWMREEILRLIKVVDYEVRCSRDESTLALRVGYTLAQAHLKGKPASPPPPLRGLHLLITLVPSQSLMRFEWHEGDPQLLKAAGQVRCETGKGLIWELEIHGQCEVEQTSSLPHQIQDALDRWRQRLPVPASLCRIRSPASGPLKQTGWVEERLGTNEDPWEWAKSALLSLAEAAGTRSSASPLEPWLQHLDPALREDFLRHERRMLRKEEKREQEEQRRREAMERRARERQRREQREAQARRVRDAAQAPSKAPAPAQEPERPPLPPVGVRVEFPALQFQETAFPLPHLGGFLLREKASLYWISNQSDDLLALPHCRIQRLEYQVRTALRVLGPLRGRALLSDEVGLGKTIEAGLVLKELVIRGMVKRFLILTVPSLVDQWEEELSDKFNLPTVTTNHPGAKSKGEAFWRESAGIVASLHTLKQPAQLETARTVNWDLLIVDEAHYLRKRDSQAWQAVNALPRQFLLLLTATPVQNSLEELYNLVTLLQPGQLPSPKEFKSRFLDPQHPRQPREPEELRRLLGQVMIRNTRANAGLDLPPRQAETVMFEPGQEERAFWEDWDREFREELRELAPSQANLWGRLLLQAAGSSPAAWRDALQKFPNQSAASTWKDKAPLQASWNKKCALLPPLTRAPGGLVIFTQFLQTQAAVAESLRASGLPAFVINGSTPAAQRHPITEQFRREGGALLLTHSGTEGRNLQFCHRLVNFDLPWNPMEIEQRIGRLHRLGQKHPVRIYNLVQAGTLQEHLLAILQEKLNLFELVVGETGLILGERYSSDEFADEVLRRWRESEGSVAESLASLGEELAAARSVYAEVKQIDETLFAKDYESL